MIADAGAQRANGPWYNPPGIGRAIVAPYVNDPRSARGISVINRNGISIGVGGKFDDSVSNDAYSELVELVAWHADRAKVPHTTPYSDDLIQPDTGVSFVLWRTVFAGEQGDPGRVIKELTAPLVQDVRARLRQYQEG